MAQLSISCTPFAEITAQYGQGEESKAWGEWKEIVEDFFVETSVEGLPQKRAILRTLGGPKIRDAMPAVVQNQTWEQIVEAIGTALGTTGTPTFSRYKLASAKQESNETFVDYVDRLKGVAKGGHNGANIQQAIMDSVANNARSIKMREYIFSNPNASLADVTRYGMMLEQLEERQKSQETSTLAVMPKQPVCGNCGYEHKIPDVCPARNKQCQACGKLNHFAKVCRSRPAPQPRQQHRYARVPAANTSRTHHPFTTNLTRNAGHRNNPRSYPAVGSSSNQIDAPNAAGVDPQQDPSFQYSVYASGITTREKLRRVTINGVDTLMLPDTSSESTIVNLQTYNKLDPKPPLEANKTPNLGYNSSVPLPIVGKFTAELAARGNRTKTSGLVIDSNCLNILGCEASEMLNFVKIVRFETPLEAYPNLFRNTTGLLKYVKVKLHIDDSIVPTQDKHRRTPYRVRERVEDEINRMLKDDVIERIPANEPTTWISPTTVVEKKDGGIRLCIDCREANQAIKRERHMSPIMDDIRNFVAGYPFLTHLDLSKAYNQIELDPASRHVTTFSTHMGLFRFKRLFFGLKSAAEVFQNTISTLLRDIADVMNVSDDLLIRGKDKKHSDEVIHRVLARLDQHGLVLNAKKCEFGQPVINFFGIKLSGSGMAPTDDRVKALQQAKEPRSIGEVNSLLGAVNWSSPFIRDLATTSQPLRDLVKKPKFEWLPEHTQALNKIKKSLTTDAIGHFNPKWNTEIVVDASPFGLGAILRQKNPRNPMETKVIEYGSKLLSPVERRYAHIEKEALAIPWACKKFHLYVYGSPIRIITDSLPVAKIFGNVRSKPTPRIERFLFQMTPYEYEIVHQPGQYNPGDYLSRQPIEETNAIYDDELEHHVDAIVSNNMPTAVTLSQLIAATEEDPILQKVIKMLRGEDCDNNQEIEPFKRVKHDLTVTADGIVLKNDKIVVPAKLQQDIIDIAHSSHSGIVKTKALIREKVWFPKINDLVEKTVAECLACQATTGNTSREPIMIPELPEQAWHTLSCDFYSPLPNGHTLLVVHDTRSKYKVVSEVTTTSYNAVKPKLDLIFAQYGIPFVLRSDNGPPFNGQEFEAYCNSKGIKHMKITPEHPEANGDVENFMKAITKSLQCAKIENKPWQQELTNMLMLYRATPHSMTGQAPASLLFGRNIRTCIPEIPSQLSNEVADQAVAKETNQRLKNKAYADAHRHTKESNLNVGDMVMAKQRRENKLMSKFNPMPFKVIAKKGSMVTARNHLKETTRNSSHFKKVSQNFEKTWQQNENLNKSKKKEVGTRRYDTNKPCQILIPLANPRVQVNEQANEHLEALNDPQVHQAEVDEENRLAEQQNQDQIDQQRDGDERQVEQHQPQVPNPVGRPKGATSYRQEYQPHSSRADTNYSLRKPG